MSLAEKVLKKTRYKHDQRVHNTNDAEILVPHFISLTNPKSVVDVGCGLGTFLKVFKEHGVTNVVGIEGLWLDKNKTLLEPAEMVTANLEEPLRLEQRFDLAICLEVAEHLREDSSEEFVRSLTGLSDYIIFSAGIPYQGGQNHINEQWPSWWAERFEKEGYSFYDVIRPQIWNNDKLFWWYKQNIFLIINDKVAHQYKKEEIMDIVHPDLFTFKAGKLNNIVTGKYDLPSYIKHLFFGILMLPRNLYVGIRRMLS